MKFLQLNLYKGKCLPAVLDFIKKESFDLIHMQEVSGSRASFNQVDCFKEIREQLAGELLVSWQLTDDPESYFGNATFYKPSLQLKERVDVRYSPFREIEDPATLASDLHPKNALMLRFQQGEKEFWSINTHMPWGPTPFDEPYKVSQAKMLADVLKTLEAPFILSGDFNVIADTEVIRMIDPFATNQARGVTNTLNPTIHRAKHLFPPGLAVDFIFTSGLSVSRFKVLEKECLSDHLGLVIEYLF